MVKSILGKKVGMTQVFCPDGRVIPVTVVLAGPCVVVQKKTVETDGYTAVKVGFGDIKERNVIKPDMGVFKKAGVAPRRHVRELAAKDVSDIEIGSEIKADVFAEGDSVDVSGISRGKGFRGVIARWGQHRGPMAHGSHYHRRPGSMGACSSPSRVFKNKHLPGHTGSRSVTVQNLEVVRVDVDKNVLLIKGALPGANGSLVTIRQSVKA